MHVFEIVVAVIVPLILLIVLVTWFVIYTFNRRYQNYLSNEKNSVRSFIVDKKNKSVRFFNHTNVRNVRVLTLDQFYAQFAKENVNELDAWFEELLKKGDKVSKYFEIKVYMNRTKKRYYSILKVTQVNKERRLLHVDSYLFLHLENRTKHGYKLKDMPYEEAIKPNKYTPENKGVTLDFAFSFVDKNNTKNVENKLLYTQLKEVALRYAYPPRRYIVSISSNEFVVVDLKCKNEEDVLNFVNKILDSMNRLLEINSEMGQTSISVGIVKNEYFPKDLKKLIEIAQKMAAVAADKQLPLAAYTVKNRAQLTEDKYTSEIEHVLKEKRLRYTFTCVYDVKKERVLGYLSHVNTANSSLNTITELYARAVKTAESKKLLTAIVNDSLDIYTELNKDTTKIIFRDLKFIDSEYFIQLINKHKDLRIAPCFDEYDISYYVSSNKNFNTIINKLKSAGTYPCLKLSDKSLILDQRIYEAFDYFIVYLNKEHFKRNDSSIYDYRIIVEKLLRFNKPIIVTRAETWSVVELLVRSGIEYVSGNALSPMNKDLISPTSKNILKIRKMLE